MTRAAWIATGIIGSVLAFGGVSPALAAPVVTITGNSGTLRVTNYLPLSITEGNVANPYGVLPANPGSPTVTITGSTVQISLTPTADFSASAINVAGGETTEFDGKLDFDVHFDSPVLLQAVFGETGNYTASSGGTVSVIAGVVISETGTAIASDGGTFSSSFSGGTWGAGLTTAGFNTPDTDFHFSIDNTLVAEALGDPAAAASINKTALVITINTAPGAGVPEPASLGILALGIGGILARRRRPSSTRS